MDALTRLLDGPRGRGAILLRVLLDPPWSLRLQDDAPIGLITVLRGGAWATTAEGGHPIRLEPGAVVLAKGQNSVQLADDPETPTQVVVNPRWTCLTPGGEELGDSMNVGVRAWGHREGASTAMLVACYQVRGEISQRVLDALPAALRLEPGSWNDALVPVLADEIGTDSPGQRAVLDRLFDLLLITVIREWFTRPEAEVPAWYQAHGDPVVGSALQLLHEKPADSWTVGKLAAETGVSRSAFARSFAERVGVPPMTYLREWRLSLAADLMIEPHRTLDAIAHQVGYSDGFVLSTVFKRERGISPQAYRESLAGSR